MRMIIQTTLALLLGIGLIGCGDSGSGGTGGTGGGDSSQTIAEIVAGDPEFSTLLTALEAAGLVDTLNGDGPFTVFAPTNAAFDALPDGTLEALLDDIPTLTAVLTYHAATGALSAADVLARTSITTLQGEDVQVQGEDATLNGSVNITMTDVNASNGVVHVIDAVLLPPSSVPIPTVLGYYGEFGTLLTAVTAADLAETLSGEGPFTLFAPNDAAFEALPEGVLEDLLDDIPALTNVLLYHAVIGEALDAAQVTAMETIEMAQEDDVTVTVDGSTVMINDATITAVDIVASNGIMHFIDGVLIPPSE